MIEAYSWDEIGDWAGDWALPSIIIYLLQLGGSFKPLVINQPMGILDIYGSKVFPTCKTRNIALTQRVELHISPSSATII